MRNNEVLELLNTQMNYEFHSANIYLGMASYCSSIGLKGFENWFKVQYKEEVDHAMKFFDFINSRGGRAMIHSTENEVANDFKDVLEVLNKALEHEELVSKKIHDVAKTAFDNADLTSFSFIQWFIEEQVEEEETLKNIIADVKRVKDAGLYLIDRELGTREFVPL